jgi:hypothetical protein
MSKETIEQFEKDRYLFVKGFIDPELAKLMTTYTLHKVRHEISPEGANGQIPHTHSVHGDHLMESVFEQTWPKMEELTGVELWPTYTFYRVYKQGDILKHHTDRPACEVSATICLGYDYSNLDAFKKSDYNWKLWVNNTANGKQYGGEPEADIGYEMQPGDAIVYRGCEVDHWREEFKGIMQSQVFFHYCNRNGPFKDAKFDCRPGLGYPHTTKDAEAVKRLKEAEAKYHGHKIDTPKDQKEKWI